jgi:tetratricopeptide (TPR) repeat protein
MVEVASFKNDVIENKKEQTDVNIEKQTLRDIFDIFSFFDIKFIPREEFNKLRGNIIEKKGDIVLEDKVVTDKGITKITVGKYVLKLPNDLKTEDLPWIILRIHKLTFWNKEVFNEQATELKVKVLYLYKTTLQEYNTLVRKYYLNFWLDSKKVKEVWENLNKKLNFVKKLAKVYYKLWWNYEDLKNLDDEKFENLIDKFYDWLKNKEKEKEIKKIRQELSELKQEILENNDEEKILDNEVMKAIVETLFERAQVLAKEKMTSMTKEEFNTLKKIDIFLNVESFGRLSDKVELLKKKIWIEKYKKELEELRKRWDKEAIAKKELEATNKILQVLYNNLPYIENYLEFWYQPQKILGTKEVYCVWFSFLWHSFLDELHIKHKVIDFPKHSALEVDIWWKKYYFDAASTNKLYPITYLKNIWYYKIFKLDFKVISQTGRAIIWEDPEKTLINQMLNNRSSLLLGWIIWSISKKVPSLKEKSLDQILHNWHKFDIDRYMSENEKSALKELLLLTDYMISIDPNFEPAYLKKWAILYIMWRYNDALKIFNKSLVLLPANKGSYLYKW